MLRAGLVGPEQRLQGDDDYVCVSLLIDWEIGGARRIAKIRFRDLSTKRSKNTRRVGPQRLDCCAKPSGHAPSPSFWGWVRHAHSVRMTVPGPNFISHMPGTDPSMVRLHSPLSQGIELGVSSAEHVATNLQIIGQLAHRTRRPECGLRAGGRAALPVPRVPHAAIRSASIVVWNDV